MSSDNPGLRIGNDERDEAARLLEEQAAQGRLAPDELGERIATVRAARTRDDLGPAFLDLPVDPPTGEASGYPLYPGTDAVTGAPVATGGQALDVPGASGLPAAAPAGSDRPEASPAMKRVGATIMALLWPAALIINFAVGWHLWWLFLIPVFGAGWIAYAFGLGGKPGEDNGRRRQRDRHQWRHD